MRASRLVSIVLLLQARGQLTARELADLLEVSVRTIYRDMESLNAAGIPVFGEPRRDGGYRLVDGYRTRLTGLTAKEAGALFLAGVPAAAAALGLAEATTTVQLKLMAAIPSANRAHAEHARQRVHVDPTLWGSIADPDPWLPHLHSAIWNDQLIRIRYGTSSRAVLIAPLGLVCKGTCWYLVALRGTDHRTYRISRIRDVRPTDASFRRPDHFDLAAHWRETSNAYADRFPRTTVTLRLRGDALARAGWVQARSKTMSEPDPDGWVDATLVLEDEDNALAVIRVLGSEVIVLEPDNLRRKAIVAARAFAADNARRHTPGAQNTLPSGSAQTQ